VIRHQIRQPKKQVPIKQVCKLLRPCCFFNKPSRCSDVIALIVVEASTLSIVSQKLRLHWSTDYANFFNEADMILQRHMNCSSSLSSLHTHVLTKWSAKEEVLYAVLESGEYPDRHEICCLCSLSAERFT